MLQVEHLSGGYSEQNILKDISFTVERGEMFGILGPNGSGKSTLLKMISRLVPFKTGKITVAGRPLQAFSSKDLAKMMAVLPQASSEVFPFTVKETVELGRYAHQRGLFHSWTQKDESVVQEAMELTKVQVFQDASIQDLSGGERQRAFLSQALAQEPEILLLDEPTNHLDLSHQKNLLDQLKIWTREKGLTVITVFHDLNLASLYCDRLLLLSNGQVVQTGSPEEVLNESLIRSVYHTEIEKLPHPEVPKPNMVLVPEIKKAGGALKEGHIRKDKETVRLESPFFLKTILSAPNGSGVGWKKRFKVKNGLSANEQDPQAIEMIIQAERIYSISKTFGTGDHSIIFVLTADRHLHYVHTWLVINGHADESVLIEALATGLEAKEKALRKYTRSTVADDGLAVAFTQTGKEIVSARPSSEVGETILRGVMECVEALLEEIVLK
ncbi:ATP-binding cassette domain-containing protein [Siminovitchia sediminis]|uniref:ATP-binding cassette domain-containing protein n=1 Tax=Siminovitchia sediminis TaxID=1274353 RepID=A0ABW4KMH8_9BACI